MRIPFAVAALLLAASALADYSSDPAADRLLDDLRDEHGFSEPELALVREALRDAQRLPQLVELEQKAPERTETWTQYSRRIDDARIRGGIALLREHEAVFDRVEEEFGVPPAVVAAVLGIETRYGRVTGKNRVLDALATQGFEHPTRAPFFFSELEHFFVFCRDWRYAPGTLLGSYAGAMGAAQFMPSNYRRLAVDYDGDGRRDLWTLPDAIGSIGRYFIDYRPLQAWHRGEPLMLRATLDGPLPAGFEVNGKYTGYRFADAVAAGFVPEATLPPDTPVGIVQLALDGGGSEYWLALHNFYTVMTYNPRTYYAMAVAQLARRIQEQRTAEEAGE